MKAKLFGIVISLDENCMNMLVQCNRNKKMVLVDIMGEFSPSLPAKRTKMMGMHVEIKGRTYFQDGDIIVEPNEIQVLSVSHASPGDPSFIGQLFTQV